jgi:hypothetical protein
MARFLIAAEGMKWNKLACSLGLAVTLAAGSAAGLVAPPIGGVCAGDCNGDQQVTVDELLSAVRIALRMDPPYMCAACDSNFDQAVSVAELVGAVTHSLSGCPQPPTPTPVIDRYEPDDTAEEAVAIHCGEEQIRTLAANGGDQDWLVFTLDSPWTGMSVWTNSGETRLDLLSAAGTPLFHSDYGMMSRSCGMDALPAGLYRIRVTGYPYSPSYAITLGCEPCTAPNPPTPTPMPADDYEPDDYLANAAPLPCGALQHHTITPLSDIDTLRFTLSEPANGIAVEALSGDGALNLVLRASDGSFLEQVYYAPLIHGCAVNPLPAGDYTLEISAANAWAPGLAYDLALDCTTCDESNPPPPASATPTAPPTPTAVVPDRFEPDGTAEQATRIDCNTIHEATLAPAGDVDWLLFRTDAPTTDVRITARGHEGYLYPSLLTGAGTFLEQSDTIDRHCGDDALPAGEYRLRVEGYSFYGGGLGYQIALSCLPCDRPNPTRTATPTPFVPTPVPRDAYEPDNTMETARPMQCGTIQRHSIAPSGDRDWLRLTLTEPATEVSVVPFNAYGGVNIVLSDASGAMLFFPYGTTPRCTEGGLAAGDYWLTIDSPYSIEPFVYDLAVGCAACDGPIPSDTPTPTATPTPPTIGPDAFEPDDSPSTAHAIGCNDRQVHTLPTSTDQDWMRFALDDPYTEVRIDAVGDFGFVARTRLRSADRAVLDESDFGIERRCGIDALEAGQYELRVSTAGAIEPFSYQLTLRCLPCSGTNAAATPTATPTPTPTMVLGDAFEPDDVRPGVIACGEVQEHTIAPSGEHDRVGFTLPETMAVLVEMTPNDGYLSAQLLDHMGYFISNAAPTAFFGCQAGGLPTGEYTLEIDGYGFAQPEVAYRVEVLCFPCADTEPAGLATRPSCR